MLYRSDIVSGRHGIAINCRTCKGEQEMKIRPTTILSAAISLGAAGSLFLGSCAAAGLDDYKDYLLPAISGAEAGKKNLNVMFIGVATLLFDDGETAIMTDGYFTRPDLQSVRTTKIKPDHERIVRSLQRAGAKSLAAVITVHSHFDHALDSPIVAQETGALLVGSNSTANIGRGYGFPEARIRVVAGDGETLTFGRFKVTFLKSEHFPNGFAPGEIVAPLSPPASATDFKVGDSDSLLIEHEGRTILVQGSAGFVPGALQGRKADVVYLGIGGLESRDAAYRNAYWHELVQSVGARRVIPIHWDNFFKSLDEPLTPGPGFDKVMQFLLDRGKAENVDIRLPVVWTSSDPFSGL
jgi:L-ascorbate metabolism protein UlaG (beta-lactamase superfamily)